MTADGIRLDRSLGTADKRIYAVGDVAGGPVEANAIRRRADTCGLQIEMLDVRPPPEREQKMRAFDHFRPGCAGECDLNLRQLAAEFRDLDAGAQANTFARERTQHDRGGFRIIARQRRARFQNGNIGAKPAKRLRQLEPNGRRADPISAAVPRRDRIWFRRSDAVSR